MRINVSRVLTDERLGATTFTRKRPTTTLSNEGEAKDSYPSNGTATLSGIVQPAATADANLLPEGVRLSDVEAFFTSGDISPGGPSQNPDLLIHNGATYQTLHVQAFGEHGLVKALAQRVHVGVAGA